MTAAALVNLPEKSKVKQKRDKPSAASDMDRPCSNSGAVEQDLTMVTPLVLSDGTEDDAPRAHSQSGNAGSGASAGSSDDPILLGERPAKQTRMQDHVVPAPRRLRSRELSVPLACSFSEAGGLFR